MARKKRTLWTRKKEQQFLALLAEGNTVAHAATVCNIARTTVYEHRALDETFAQAWDAAESAGTEALEQIAKQRATVGHEYTALTKDGEPITLHTLPSDTLLIFLLKGRKPDTYRDNVNINNRVTHDLSGLLALARQAPDEPVAFRPNGVLPARIGEDPVDETGGDSH